MAAHSLVRTVPNQGATYGVRPGFFAVAESRLGLLEYRPHDVPVGRSLDWYGEYLQPQLDILARLIRPGATILEVGAGIGAHSVFLSSLVGPNGHLIIYESDPLLKRILHKNVALVGSKNV